MEYNREELERELKEAEDELIQLKYRFELTSENKRNSWFGQDMRKDLERMTKRAAEMRNILDQFDR